MKTIYRIVFAIMALSFAFSACDRVQEPFTDAKKISSFSIDGLDVVGMISEEEKTVVLRIPKGTDVSRLTPTIVVSKGATVSPESGVEQDFTNPVEYTVTAINGSTAVYTVSVAFGDDPAELQGKTVLLKDFTGVRCPNCPAAADLAHEMQAEYGGKLIVMSVHAGFLAMPLAGYPDFRTTEGTEWYNNNSSNPLGAVDRVMLLEGYVLQDSEWRKNVAEAMNQEQSVEIRVSNSYNESTRLLSTTINAERLKDLAGDLDLYLTVCVLEDNIVGKQLIPSGMNPDYVHRHVFRTTLNGAYGERVAFDADGKLSKSYTFTVPEEYDASNCSIVAYIYDNNQEMLILQTAEKRF